jgi:hypothetical protein
MGRHRVIIDKGIDPGKLAVQDLRGAPSGAIWDNVRARRAVRLFL